MPHELTVPTDPAANGHIPPHESLLDRAKRILAGDVRPDDYLTVPDELRAQIENEIRLAQSLRPHRVLGDAERKSVWHDRILMHHHDGKVVAALHLADGVIVLGVGVEEIEPLVRQVPFHIWKGVIIEHPFSGAYCL